MLAHNNINHPCVEILNAQIGINYFNKRILILERLMDKQKKIVELKQDIERQKQNQFGPLFWFPHMLDSTKDQITFLTRQCELLKAEINKNIVVSIV